MTINRNLGQDMWMAKGTIKHTSTYKYLGVQIQENSKDNDDITKKMGNGKAITTKLLRYYWENKLPRRTK